MAAARQIRLAVVTSESPGLSSPYSPMGVVIRTQMRLFDAELARLPDSGPAQAGEAGAVEIFRPP